MKVQIALIATLLGSAALAQTTTIGNVTITRPGDVRQTAPVRPATAAPARTPVTSATAGQAKAIAVPSDLPNGWRHLQGRVVAPSSVRLPAGSRVQVTIEELDRQGATRSVYLKVDFPTTKLSTPYNVQYSSQRLNAQSTYVVRAKVFDGNGRTLYTTKALHRAPDLRSASMNINVSR
ncbi:YbaY family lipoprotein [Deinococcus sp. Marseille-Q6407]|uniref:YbaY family lipoprotein n=1 Tax=Deinococcus sp. Marseille-Q6407 TaxID=2969223 RepID=UPI0021C06197|nr:YbaY family lipoprotein [Deinococcus sp. Marseille-Q6407]